VSAKKFSLDFDLVEKKEIIFIAYKNQQYRVRVFNITLPSGEKEILITNLQSKHLKYKEAADLYFERWGIESKFDNVKNKLKLENMSGRRAITTYQGFGQILTSPIQ
jgi:hypothetical protein